MYQNKVGGGIGPHTERAILVHRVGGTLRNGPDTDYRKKEEEEQEFLHEEDQFGLFTSFSISSI